LSKRTKEQISDIMRRVKSEHTTPEIKFRKALWARGVRYRLHDSRLPGKPDIVVPKARLAIFIDGDFWHGNQWRTRGYASLEAQFVASPKAEYWVGKIGRNIARDMESTARLQESGWNVLRFWESEVKSDLQRCVEMALAAIEISPH
jgi:DNA mismatch endonuclease, patch repair protein